MTTERCEHGVRWPHPCDDCHEEDCKPHNLIAKIEELQARLEEAEKLLREVRDDLACSTPVSEPDARICDELEKLADASGYGAIMSTASALWRKYLADKGYPKGGEFIAGPCRTTAENAVGRITAFLKQGEAS